jgi:hypothetical protein
MEVVGMYVYFMAIWSILRQFGICIVWLFGIFFGYLVYFVAIWYIFGYLVYFVAIWYILWLFGIFFGYLVYFSPFWYCVPRKIWQP